MNFLQVKLINFTFLGFFILISEYMIKPLISLTSKRLIYNTNGCI